MTSSVIAPSTSGNDLRFEPWDTEPIIDFEAPGWEECRESCVTRLTGIQNGVRIKGMTIPCKTRSHRAGAHFYLKSDLEHLVRIWGPGTVMVEQVTKEPGRLVLYDVPPRLWVAWVDYSKTSVVSALKRALAELRSSGQRVETMTFHRDAGPSLLVASCALAVPGLVGELVDPAVAFAHARTWLRAPGVKKMRPGNSSWWSKPRTDPTFERALRGYDREGLLRHHCAEEGVFEPDPADFHGGVVPELVKLRFEANVRRVARRLQAELEAKDRAVEADG